MVVGDRQRERWRGQVSANVTDAWPRQGIVVEQLGCIAGFQLAAGVVVNGGVHYCVPLSSVLARTSPQLQGNGSLVPVDSVPVGRQVQVWNASPHLE